MSNFNEWSSLFSERLFVMLQVYADESETHATSIGGFVASSEYWIKFSKQWQEILDDFKAPFFHFREFASKHQCAKPNSPYYKWSESKRDKFLHDLATLMGDEAMPIGGGYAPNVGDKQTPKERWEKSLIKLFQDLNHVLADRWPNYAGRILFVFDKGNTEEKNLAVLKIHKQFSEKDNRYGGLTFEDDKDPLHLPLQAADLCSYVSRQAVEDLEEVNGILKAGKTRMLDLLLLRNRNAELRRMNPLQWRIFVGTIMHHRKGKRAEWKKKGIKRTYFPNEDFPWHIYEAKPKSKKT